MITPAMTFDDLKENFALFDEWDDRYEYIIDLGRKLPPFPASLQTDAHKVRGCMSQVWLVPGHPDGKPELFAFAADSDSVIVKGLIAVLGILFSGQTPEAIAAIDPVAALRDLGFEQHLAPTRRNGLVAMVQKIKQSAAAQAA
ncbi:MAG: SufE family protein [Rhodospirillaceae bacterium]|nr:SufE family protein [Rhodospirillaceae bacterium]